MPTDAIRSVEDIDWSNPVKNNIFLRALPSPSLFWLLFEPVKYQK